MENIKTRHCMEEILTFLIKPWKKIIKYKPLLGMTNVSKENLINIPKNNNMLSIFNLQAQRRVKKSLKTLEKYKNL